MKTLLLSGRHRFAATNWIGAFPRVKGAFFITSTTFAENPGRRSAMATCETVALPARQWDIGWKPMPHGDGRFLKLELGLPQND